MTNKQKQELNEIRQSICECLDKNIDNYWKDCNEILNLINLIYSIFRKLEIY